MRGRSEGVKGLSSNVKTRRSLHNVHLRYRAFFTSNLPLSSFGIPIEGGTKLHNVAVVLAGGTGQRMGLEIPKQLVKIAGKPIMQHTLQIFQSAPQIDEIIGAMTPGFTAEAGAGGAAAGGAGGARGGGGGAARAGAAGRARET